MLCNYDWRAPRIFTNTSGEKFESLPVNHVCGESYGPAEHSMHKCICGETTPNIIEI